MLQIKLGNNSILDSVTVVRELIQLPLGIPEVDIEFAEVTDLVALYNTVLATGALENMTVIDTTGEEPDTTLMPGYNTVKGLERTLDSIGTPGFRTTLRITKE